MRKPLFASNRCLRSRLFTNSRVALPIAPAMLLASTFIVRPSEPTFRSSYFNVTLYVFKVISLKLLFAGWVCRFSLTYFLDRFSAAFSVATRTSLSRREFRKYRACYALLPSQPVVKSAQLNGVMHVSRPRLTATNLLNGMGLSFPSILHTKTMSIGMTLL
jgi:hypothetical protein